MYDCIIVGGGFYGSMIAQSLPGKICLIEKEPDLFTKATKNNQARIHNGYHYPRHHLTAWSSYRNYARFCNEFNGAIIENETMLYPIAYKSKVSPTNFFAICRKIGIPIIIAPNDYQSMFNPELIEQVFIGQEGVFNYLSLKEILLKRLRNVEILLKSKVIKVTENTVHLQNEIIKGKRIILCTYSSTNEILKNSNLPELPLVFEHTYMPVIKVPLKFKHIGITIMDGNFFSIYPFPTLNAHTIHHVRFTPTTTVYNYFYTDVVKYIPEMKDMKHLSNIFETKTILAQNEIDDGRPILYRKDYNLPNFDVVVGGKLDNIYDLLDYMKSSETLNIT